MIRLSSYALVAAGVLVALSTVGINLTSLAIFASAVGVGVGLGLHGEVVMPNSKLIENRVTTGR